MPRLSSLLSFIFITCVVGQQKQPYVPKLPCPEIYYYTHDRSQFYGILVLSNYEPSEREINIRINLSIGAQVNSYGHIDLEQDQNAAVHSFENNYPIFYKVTLPLQNILPNLDSIYYNNRLICQGPTVPKGRTGVTTINLIHKLTMPNNEFSNFIRQTTWKPQNSNSPDYDDRFYSSDVTPSTQKPIVRLLSTTQRPSRTVPKTEQYIASKSSRNQQCGRSIAVVSLIKGGRKIRRGQWPWIVAFFHQISLVNSDFICSGSLVSHTHVITSAHCIQEKYEIERRNPRRSVFYFGKHDLESLDEVDYQRAHAREFIMHPDWDIRDSRYDADIAIAILDTHIEYNYWVQPICLWSGSSDLDLVRGKKGTIIGWGFSEHSVNSNEPLEVEVPIVSTGNCVLSNHNFNYIISNRTFCAGNNALEGPCNGDSGGGLFLFQNGAWRLRGVVSVSLVDPETRNCDVKNHAVFTDAAKFTPWINSIIYS